MKAARIKGPRRPVVFEEVEDPSPGPGQVVVRIAASGVCHSDLHIAMGDFKGIRYPLTLGHEPAGYVHRTGRGVKNVREGDAVLVYIARGCGKCWSCRRGAENECGEMEVIGFDRDGCHAEYLLVDSERYLFPIQGLNINEAAPLACAGITAYHAVKAKALGHLNPDDYVAVIGVGGLGHIALQLLKKLGPARIVAIDRTEEKLRQARKLGADYVLMYGRGMNAEVRSIAKSGLAVVIDFVGSSSTLSESYDMLKTGGRLVIVGAAGGRLRVQSGSTSSREVHGSILGSLHEMQEVIDLARNRVFRTVTKAYPLDGIKEVLRLLRQGRMEGRAVLRP